MYKIPNSKQTSFRVSDYEKNVIDEFLISFQESENKDFGNFRDVFLAIIESHKLLEKENQQSAESVAFIEAISKKNKELQEELSKKTLEVEQVMEALNEAHEISNTSPADLSILFKEINSSVFEGEEKTELEMLQELVNIINSPTPAVEIEKTVEVERKLNENERVFSFTADQLKILKTIARWRAYKKIDEPLKTVQQTVKAMIFNLPTLTNEGECFKTGLTYNRAKKRLQTQ